MMKAYKYIIATLLLVCSVSSCEKWPDRQVFTSSSLGAVNNFYQLPETASEIHVDVIASMPYEIRCDADWLSMPATSQGRDGFNVICQRNEGLTRQATILLAIDNANHYNTVTILQKGPTAIISLNGSEAGVEVIDMKHQIPSYEPYFEYYNGATGWIDSIEAVGNELEIKYQKNETGFPRFASINLSYWNADGDRVWHRFDLFQTNSSDSVQPSAESYIDLTKDGKWANCYLLQEKRAQAYSVEVKNISGEIISDKIRYAEVLWETTKGLVSDVVYVHDDNKLYFEKSADVRGNAVVAFKDYNENILWSSHLWISGETVNEIKVGGISFLDRNLGAMTNQKPLNSESDAAGMYYQWGRKDPFPSPTSLNASGGSISMVDVYPIGAISTSTQQNGVTYETSVANPNIYYWGSHNKGAQDWSSTSNVAYWSTEAKTDYDPCPHGYVVPDKSQMEKFVAKFPSTADENVFISFKDDDNTENFFCKGGYFRRKQATTHFAHVGQQPHCWTTDTGIQTETSEDAKKDRNKDYYGAYATGAISGKSLSIYARRWGCNIRCVKENSN